MYLYLQGCSMLANGSWFYRSKMDEESTKLLSISVTRKFKKQQKHDISCCNENSGPSSNFQISILEEEIQYLAEPLSVALQLLWVAGPGRSICKCLHQSLQLEAVLISRRIADTCSSSKTWKMQGYYHLELYTAGEDFRFWKQIFPSVLDNVADLFVIYPDYT